MDGHGRPAILGVGTSLTPDRHPQEKLGRCFAPNDPKSRRFFDHPHIHARHVQLPPVDPISGHFKIETTGELLAKHRKFSVRQSREAMDRALADARVTIREIDFLCCVTSTGFTVPGLSAQLIKEAGLRANCQRIDIVGMGCNAGLNALNVTSAWCSANPGKRAVVVCAEICSAIYAPGDTEQNAIVNSLFGDGIAAVVLSTTEPPCLAPRLLGFESHLIPEHSDSLRFDWDDVAHRFSFVVQKETPKVLAENFPTPLRTILSRHALTATDVKHWLVHSGGAAILDAIERKLDLPSESFRHTRSVLRDFGNVSSGSIFFTYDRLRREKTVRPGDFGVIATMGPGLTIELAIVKWE